MVFSQPPPLYLDPHNWHHHQQQAQLQQQQQQQQEHQNQQLGASATTHGGQHHQIAVQMPPPAPSQAVGCGSSSSIRPGSMADRARQAKIPQPEPGLKCPRCESTNTKFCYFNNYSLTQPRHFCKMCRRYWTKGGALRNVPVGGGCRRNKRSSKNGGGSKTLLGDQRQAGMTGQGHNSTSPISSSSNNTDMNNNNNINSSSNPNHGNMLDSSIPGQNHFQRRLTHQFPLLTSLEGLNNQGQYGSLSSNLGLNFGGMISNAAQAELGFQIGARSGNNNSDQWRPHNFPNFLAAFEPPQVPHRPSSSSNLYQFQIDHQQSMDQQSANSILPRSLSINSAMDKQTFRPSMPSNNSNENQQISNEAAVKPEEAVSRGSGMNSLSRSFLGISDNNQYWGAADNNSTTTWTDLSALSSSTTRLL